MDVCCYCHKPVVAKTHGKGIMESKWIGVIMVCHFRNKRNASKHISETESPFFSSYHHHNAAFHLTFLPTVSRERGGPLLQIHLAMHHFRVGTRFHLARLLSFPRIEITKKGSAKKGRKSNVSAITRAFSARTQWQNSLYFEMVATPWAGIMPYLSEKNGRFVLFELLPFWDHLHFFFAFWREKWIEVLGFRTQSHAQVQ